jgi:deoxycytidylate deaminase
MGEENLESPSIEPAPKPATNPPSPASIAELIYPPNGGEIFIGFVSPVGTNEQRVVDEFTRELKARDYRVEEIKFSQLIQDYAPATAPVNRTSEFDRIRSLQLAGNELRKLHGGDILTELACAKAASLRSQDEPPGWVARPKRVVFFLRSLKNPDEAALLRTIYGHGFYLVAMHSSYDSRVANLIKRGMDEEQAKELMKFDDKESSVYGQNTRETFELADFYVNDAEGVNTHVERFANLLFGALYITPTKEEYGMHMAASAAQRSGDLSRQVGAAICDARGDIISAGCNEVPKAGGGSYWPEDEPDVRDWALGHDPNDAEKTRRFELLKAALSDLGVSVTQSELSTAWSESGLRDITEFGRTVHAEMDAIMSCARRGVSLGDATLYATTFPCHNCARHIVASGIMTVVYIEPYAKSEAYSLYGDSIECPAIPSPKGDRPLAEQRVVFQPFEGVAPRRFGDFFGMRHLTGRRVERKSSDGRIIPQNLSDLRTPRLQLSDFAYLQREEFATKSLQKTVLLGVQSSGKGI